MKNDLDMSQGQDNQKSVALSKEDFEKNIKERVTKISQEFMYGFDFLQGEDRTVTFFGSARLSEDDEYYKIAKEIAKRISSCGIGIITGGGPGIMEAANRGAFEASGPSLGLNVLLSAEQHPNPYLSKVMTFDHFFVRKVLLSYSAEAYIFFPGGFGTLDELFEIITLVQTGKMEKVPIILVGKSYWKKLDSFIKTEIYKRRMINKEDLKIYEITDDIDEIVNIAEHAPIRTQH